MAIAAPRGIPVLPVRAIQRWEEVVDLPDPHPSPQSSLLHSLEHCPYCSLQAAASAPPPTPAGVFLLPLTFEVPLLFLAAPRTLHAWRHALSRGPPSIA